MLRNMWLKQCGWSLMNVNKSKTTCAKTSVIPLLSQPVRRFRTAGHVRLKQKASHSFTGLDPFGKIIIKHKSPRTVTYELTCISPRDYPDQDKAFVYLGSDKLNVVTCQLDKNVLSINDKPEEYTSEDGSQGNPVSCQIEVPVKFDIVAELSGASSIKISNFENEALTVTSDEGRCFLNNIQTGQFNVRSNVGMILSEKLLQGNGVITTSGGVISLHKVLSQTLQILSQTGDVNITNLYANASQITTDKGNIHIVNSHMDTDVIVKEKGNIRVDSISGNLNARVQQGDVNVMVSDPGRISLSTEQGDVTVRIPRALSTTLEVKGNTIQIDQELLMRDVLEEKQDAVQALNATVQGTSSGRVSTGSIHAHSQNGKVVLQASSDAWLSMIQANLKKK